MDSSCRLLKRAVKLHKNDIQYKSRTATKAQALANFIVEASYQEKEQVEKEIWMLEVDGSYALSRSMGGIVMTSPDGNIFKHGIKFTFPALNNVAEYEAAIAGLRMCIADGIKSLSLETDSQLVNGQLKGDF